MKDEPHYLWCLLRHIFGSKFTYLFRGIAPEFLQPLADCLTQLHRETCDRAKRFRTYLPISPVSRKEPASASLMTSLTAPSLPPRSHAFGVSKWPTLDIFSRLNRFSMMPRTFFTILTFYCLPVNLQPRFWLSNLRSPRRLIRTKITRNSTSCWGNFCSHGSQPAQLRSSRIYV